MTSRRSPVRHLPDVQGTFPGSRDNDSITTTQVADLDGARRAVDAGIEVLIARGAEGGGHGQPLKDVLPLLGEIFDRVNVPVLAAGGIASGRTLASALAAGASGAWIGTAFAACRESTLPDAARDVMIGADSTDTLVTRAFDVALGCHWPPSIPERVIRNGFGDIWDGREHEPSIDKAALGQLRTAITDGDYRPGYRSTPAKASTRSPSSNPRPQSSRDSARKPRPS